jgi:phosphoglycolate phosphatase
VIPSFPVYLFDIDGTLLDSARDICAAVHEVLSRAGCRPLPFEYLRAHVGLHLRVLFGAALPDRSEAEIESLIMEYRELYLARHHAGTSVYPGVAEGLAALGGRKGTATTKGTPTTRAVLEQFGLLGFFDHVQGTDGFPCKPAPDVILTALKALDAKPSDCLMVGDSAADMEAGRRAGVATCAVRWGYGDPAGMALWTPDFWIDDLSQLSFVL